MKKTIKYLVVLGLFVLLCGCDMFSGEKSFVCTSSSKQTDYTLTSTYKVFYKGDAVSKVETVESVESSDESKLKTVETSVAELYKNNNEKYGGYDYKVVNKNGKLTATVVIDYSKMNLDKYVEDNPAMKSYVNDKNQITKEGIIKLYKALGAACDEE